ncbi:hypothetical protein Pst134EB_018264 [Puccinia striiformis f. sp. tritici]|nr:hypothetical protein Pst134EB_018264 [Puccinia striiformis f. sp. tritici]
MAATPSSSSPATTTKPSSSSATTTTTGPSEFVKKLYKMLSEPESESVVGWGDQRTTLVIKDQILFQRDVLPKHFKHSNFASFVRQLNKYDFRKIKIASSSSTVPPNGGSLQWEFYHPYFRADTMSEVDNIKRKVPITKQQKLTTDTTTKIDETCSTSNKVEKTTEDILNRLMTHQIQTSSALNKLVQESATLRLELDQAYRKLNQQQIQIDLLLNQSISTKEEQEELTNNKSLIMSKSTSNTYYLDNSTRTTSSTIIPKTQERWKNNGQQKPRVLIVEDDQICRRISSTILELMGYRIEFACDGLNAVNRMKTQIESNDPFDLVLMDIFMPNMDGLSATSLIRKFDLITPIISMTSNVQPVDLLKYMNIGMNDCLPKPFTKEGMFVILQKHLFNSSSATRINIITESKNNTSIEPVLNGLKTHHQQQQQQQSSLSPPNSPGRLQQPLRTSNSSNSITTASSYHLPDMNGRTQSNKRSYDPDPDPPPPQHLHHVDFIVNNNHLLPIQQQQQPQPTRDLDNNLIRNHLPDDPSGYNFNLVDHFHHHPNHHLNLLHHLHPNHTIVSTSSSASASASTATVNPHKRFKA